MFFLRCATKNLGPIIIYVIDKYVIVGNTTVSIQFSSLTELNDLLLKCDSIKRNADGDLKSYDMSLPNICVSVVKDLGKNQELLLKALHAFAYFVTTAQDRYFEAKNNFETNFKVLEAKVSFLADCLVMDIDSLNYSETCQIQVSLVFVCLSVCLFGCLSICLFI